MIVQIKDEKGNVIIEKEIEKEEVLLRLSVSEEDRHTGQKQYSLEQVFGSYH